MALRTSLTRGKIKVGSTIDFFSQFSWGLSHPFFHDLLASQMLLLWRSSLLLRSAWSWIATLQTPSVSFASSLLPLNEHKQMKTNTLDNHTPSCHLEKGLQRVAYGDSRKILPQLCEMIGIILHSLFRLVGKLSVQYSKEFL